MIVIGNMFVIVVVIILIVVVVFIGYVIVCVIICLFYCVNEFLMVVLLGDFMYCLDDLV